MKKIASIILSIVLFGCHSSNQVKASAGNDSSSASTTQQASAATNSSDAASIIKVTLTGGANAGIYNATSTDVTCSMGLTGDKSFGNQYSVDGKADNEFSSLQLIADNYDEAKAGSSNFMITIGFGKLLMGKSYTINGTNENKKAGSGTLKITESGKEKIANIDGTTSDGVHIVATITCKSVMTSNGVQ